MNRTKTALLALPAFFSVSVLSMHALLGSYTRLIADDFCSAYYAERFGLLRSIWYWRLNWSGRYTAFAMDWLLTKVIGVDNLSPFLPILLIAWFLFAWFAMYRLLRSNETRQQDVLFSGALGITFIFVLFSLTPNVPQSFYWWNGMRSYAFPLFLLNAFLAIYLYIPQKTITGKTQIALFVLFFLLFFLSGGTSETSVVFQFSLLVLLMILRWLKSFKLEWDAHMLALSSGLVGSIASLIVTVTAPGNAVRQESMLPTTNPIQILTISWNGYSAFVTEIVRAPEKLALVFGSFLLTIWIGNYYKKRFNGTRGMIPGYVVSGIILSFSCFVPGAYGYSEPPPTRVLIFAAYALSITFMFAGFLIGTNIGTVSSSNSMRMQFVIALSVLLLGYSSINQTLELYNLKDQYITYANTWDGMNAQIRAAKNNREESVTLPFINNWASLNTLTDNPRFWVNVCYSNYYDIRVLGEFPFDFKQYESVENGKQ